MRNTGFSQRNTFLIYIYFSNAEALLKHKYLMKLLFYKKKETHTLCLYVYKVKSEAYIFLIINI